MSDEKLAKSFAERIIKGTAGYSPEEARILAKEFLRLLKLRK